MAATIKQIRNLIYFLVLFCPCLAFAQTNTEEVIPPPPPINGKGSNQNCYHNGKLTVKERRSIYPFSEASIVKIISFPSFYEKDTLIEGNRLKKPFIREEITLTEKQINRLTDILYNYNYSKKTTVRISCFSTCGCYHMRHAIVFINNSNNIISLIQLDFVEGTVESELPNQSIGSFCEGKYELLETFFKKAGIQEFDTKVTEEVDIVPEKLIERKPEN